MSLGPRTEVDSVKLFGSRQLSIDVLLDFTWKELDAGLGRPFQLASPIPRKPEVLAEFKLELNFNATSAQRVQLGRDTIADRRPGPFKGLDPGPRALAVRLERGFFTPDENTAGCPPWYFELRLVFDRSPYGTQQDWRMYDLGGGDWGYWDHKTFIARHCESPPGVLQYMRDSCVMS
ncbi:hypothetical protein B9Z65_1106 [Elsinoe australis]|uniref:Uncharacterized protein n=1 Tax=Elsinoe australis TaxID=40998 RepID=A0A2P8AI97_9PEZI|nr:hypothetical protein B9Z65_1106 [Elsinoe australis]